MNEKIFPFLWLRGEERNLIEKEIDSIYNNNIRAFIVESRTHPDFCGEGWWRDMDIVLSKAKTLGMRVWVLDDKHYPTGFANDKFLEHPELTQWHIAARNADIIGCKSGRLRVGCLPEDRLLFAAAYPYKGNNIDYTSPVFLTSAFENNFLYFDLPEKPYRIVTVWKTRDGGRGDRMDLINPASVQLLIDVVYEPHYARYKELFGNTFAGFFSDEPGFYNDYNVCALKRSVNIYETKLGTEGMSYPFSDELLTRLYAHPLHIKESDLVALWTLRDERDSEIRCAYMDIVTDLYAEHFSGNIGKWCRDRGVQYIGHIIEDMNCHTHLGLGPGHYFKSQTGQNMAGIDIVLHQLEPGYNELRHLAPICDGYADPEFFDHTLSALAFSEAHIDAYKKGYSVCEIFGAYGWGLDITKMKWLLDMMLVGGVNHFVPHAFCSHFPEEDCPPHFHAQGNNPQEQAFGYLMKYAEQMCNLFSNGTPVIDIGVLYHAEADWSGREYMAVDPILKTLHENQYNAFIVPATRLDFAEKLQCLIVPYAEFLPQELKERLNGLHCKVIYVPAQGVEGVVRGLDDMGLRDITLDHPEKYLRFYHYRKDDRDYFMFFNAGTKDILVQADVRLKGPFEILDYLSALEYTTDGEDGIALNLPAGNSVVCTAGRGKEKQETELCKTLFEQYKVFLRSGKEKEFSFYKNVSLPFDVIAKNEQPAFSGTARFEISVELGEGKYLVKLLGAVGDVVLLVNGKTVGRRICKPYVYDISDFVQKGENRLCIDLSDTLCGCVADRFSCYSAIAPVGLESVEIYKIKE